MILNNLPRNWCLLSNEPCINETIYIQWSNFYEDYKKNKLHMFVIIYLGSINSLVSILKKQFFSRTFRWTSHCLSFNVRRWTRRLTFSTWMVKMFNIQTFMDYYPAKGNENKGYKCCASKCTDQIRNENDPQPFTIADVGSNRFSYLKIHSICRLSDITYYL